MNGKPETLAEIAAEIRRGERMFWTLRDCATYADRIEAAAELDRRKYERLHECFWSDGAIQNIVRQLLDARDDLRDRNPKASEVAAHFAQLLKEAATRAPGNAAAMREALERCNELFRCDDDNKSRLCNLARKADEATRTALAAPARNCDRFKTAVEAMEEWNKYPQSRYGGCRVCPHGDTNMVSPSHLTLAEWLFVPAAQ